MATAANPAPGFVKHPQHKITLEPLGKPVAVSVDGIELAASEKAILMREGDYTPVVYIPFEGIRFAQLARTESSTHCPFKGDASYWRVAGGAAGPDVMWSYEEPFDEMAEIRGYAAFYSDRVTVEVG